MNADDILPLQPLRVSSGWTISINNFYEVELSASTLEDWFSSSVLISGSRKGTGACFDAKFEPLDLESGRFVVSFFKIDYDKFGVPVSGSSKFLYTFKTKDRSLFLREIEEFMSSN